MSVYYCRNHLIMLLSNYWHSMKKWCICLQEFRRIKGNISSMREHAELLSSVRDDISEYKVSLAESSCVSPKYSILFVFYCYFSCSVLSCFQSKIVYSLSCRPLGVCLQGCSYYGREEPSMEV